MTLGVVDGATAGSGEVDTVGWLRVHAAAQATTTHAAIYRISRISQTGGRNENSPPPKGPGRAAAYQARDQSVSRVLSGGVTHRDGHFSRSTIARTLQQPTRGVFIEVGYSRRMLGLAPAGVCRAVNVAIHAVGSYPAFSPLPLSGRSVFCGTFRHDGHPSCPGITWQPYPRSPDFPRISTKIVPIRDRPTDLLSMKYIPQWNSFVHKGADVGVT
jgi:hypothetical protein